MDFQDAFRRGLGRAVLFLLTHDAQPYQETILHGCTTFIGYDAQAEPSRASYLFDIIQATDEPEWYAPRISDMLLSGEEIDAPWQIYELAGLLAKQGDALARQALYTAFARDAARHEVSNADVLIQLDGLEGYLFVVRQLLKNPLPDDDRWWESSFLDKLEEILGKEEAQAGLERACAADAELAAHVACIRQEEEQRAKERTKRLPFIVPKYAELRAMIAEDSKQVSRVRLARWGEHADAELLERLAHDTLQESDETRLVKYLHLFQCRHFPLALDRLLVLARDPNQAVASAARQALSPIADPRVRTLALELIAREADEPWEAVDLLASNYWPGDARLIEPLIAREQSEYEFHRLGISVREWFEANPVSEAAALLLILYERGLCVVCRGSVIDLLLSLGPLPARIVEECRYDADLETRTLVVT